MIQFADVDEETTILLDFIQNKTYEGALELEASFGRARDFAKFDPTTGEIVIRPEEEHTGDYTLKMKLMDESEEYDKQMLLKVISAIPTTKSILETAIQTKENATTTEEDADAQITEAKTTNSTLDKKDDLK